ncbi:hypothetical protein MA12_gp20 [Pectobacterium phage MA12]|uniref:Uncharacterized protein n=1 Tax=Pectobacterium phage MA12 TaxID=2686474 RepID=A0A6B9RJV0_9CAUD|nr:hypothetical protein JT357_gp20 [Pectobacterium phage MA12]QHI00847.1 hypothetical protein MA12_gp20 [Pectobacterium phage MA12]
MEEITVEVIYSPRRGYGIRANGLFYDFRHRPIWPRGVRSAKNDESAIRWFRKELYNPRHRLRTYRSSITTPIGSSVVYSRVSVSDERKD